MQRDIKKHDRGSDPVSYSVYTEISEENVVSPFLTLIYVPEGRVSLTCGSASAALRSGDIFLVGPEEKHSILSVGSAVVFKLLFDPADAGHGRAYAALTVDREALSKNDIDRRRLKLLLDSMLHEMSEHNRAIRLKLLYYSVYDLLFRSCLIREDRDENEPLAGILKDLNENAAAILPMSDYAARVFLSDSAFSRKFKKATGRSFSEYTAYLRTRKAAGLLWNTGMTVTEIAEQSGFKSSAVMQRHFRQIYACSPTEYRKRRSGQAGDTPIKAEALRDILSRIAQREGAGSSLIRLTITGRESERVPAGGMNCIHIGDARWLLDGDIREQLLDMPRILGIHQVAVGNLFDPDLRIREGHSTQQLHFERLDRAMDQILKAGCIPVMILPESRKVTIREIGSTPREGKYEPVFADLREWETVFRTFLMHMLERHTYASVRNWVFVFEHDPFLDSEEKCRQFQEMYECSYLLIRKYVPGAQIWADTLNSTVRPELLAADLRKWHQDGTLPDALNLMVYPYQVDVRRNARQDYDFSLLRIDTDLHFVREELESYAKLAEDAGCGDLPRVISEWNTSLSERNPYNDSCAKACHMLAQMADASATAAAMFYHGFSDLAVSGFDETEPLIGASALLTRDGIKKPAFYAMEFWGRLGDYIVSRGDHHIAATNHGTAFQILLFHPTTMSDEYKLIPESRHQMDELISETLGTDALHFEISFPEITGKKRLRTYLMSDREGAVYTEWQKLGRPPLLSPSELQYLKAKSTPSLTVSIVQSSERGITLSVSLEPNAFALIMLI